MERGKKGNGSTENLKWLRYHDSSFAGLPGSTLPKAAQSKEGLSCAGSGRENSTLLKAWHTQRKIHSEQCKI